LVVYIKVLNIHQSHNRHLASLKPNIKTTMNLKIGPKCHRPWPRTHCDHGYLQAHSNRASNPP